jgi:glutathione peroxidase
MIFDHISCLDAHGQHQAMSDYQGQLLLVVNVASHCYFTRQYHELRELYLKYHPRGLNILAFPCHQFAKQEPDDADVVEKHCQIHFDLPFPLMEKVKVNGPDTHPLFHYLKQQAPGLWGSRSIKWNFCKFLIPINRQNIERFAPMTTPSRLESYIHAQLRNTY